MSPAGLRATSQALVKSVMFGLAPVAGAFAGGVVYQSFGARTMFVSSIAVVGTAGLIALAVVRMPAGSPIVAKPLPAKP